MGKAFCLQACPPAPELTTAHDDPRWLTTAHDGSSVCLLLGQSWEARLNRNSVCSANYSTSRSPPRPAVPTGAVQTETLGNAASPNSTQPRALRSQGVLASLLLPMCRGPEAHPQHLEAPAGVWLNPTDVIRIDR